MNFDWQIGMYIKFNTIYFNTNEDNCLQHEVLQAQQDDVGLGGFVVLRLHGVQAQADGGGRGEGRQEEVDRAAALCPHKYF